MSSRIESRLRSLRSRAAVQWRNLLWWRLDPRVTLESGIELEVRTGAEWEIFVEVFVQRQYDDAIVQALGEASNPVRMIDLGANVGFFTLRAAHLARERWPTKALQVLAIEGVRRTADELRRRCEQNRAAALDVTVVHGLAGERTGTAFIYDSEQSHLNCVVGDGQIRSTNRLRNAHAVEGKYVDVEAVLADASPIDLLKCDIEGSELVFIRNYTALLRRTRRLLIELHPLHCDPNACLDLLRGLGFVLEQVIYETETVRLLQFRR